MLADDNFPEEIKPIVQKFISVKEEKENAEKQYPEYKKLTDRLVEASTREKIAIYRDMIKFVDRSRGTNSYLCSEKVEIKLRLARALLDDLCYQYYESKIEKSNITSNFLFRISPEDAQFVECENLVNSLALVIPKHINFCQLKIRLGIYKARAAGSCEILDDIICSFPVNTRDSSSFDRKFLQYYGMLFLERALMKSDIADLHTALDLFTPLQELVALWRFSLKTKSDRATLVETAQTKLDFALTQKFAKIFVSDVSSFTHEADVELILGLAAFKWNHFVRLSMLSNPFDVAPLINEVSSVDSIYKKKLQVFGRSLRLNYTTSSTPKSLFNTKRAPESERAKWVYQ